MACREVIGSVNGWDVGLPSVSRMPNGSSGHWVFRDGVEDFLTFLENFRVNELKLKALTGAREITT